MRLPRIEHLSSHDLYGSVGESDLRDRSRTDVIDRMAIQLSRLRFDP